MTAEAAKKDANTIIKEFASEIAGYVQEEKDITECCRSMEFEHGKLIEMSKRPAIGDGYLLSFTVRAIALLELEIDIAKMRLSQQGQPNHATVRNAKPSLHLIHKHHNLGVMGMTEILTAIQLLGGVGSSTGNAPTTIAFADAFERTFGFSYNDIYDRQSELFQRMPCNLTKTLDAMKAALVKEYRRRQAAKKEKESGSKTG
jgi:hypothetical protein